MKSWPRFFLAVATVSLHCPLGLALPGPVPPQAPQGTRRVLFATPVVCPSQIKPYCKLSKRLQQSSENQWFNHCSPIALKCGLEIRPFSAIISFFVLLLCLLTATFYTNVNTFKTPVTYRLIYSTQKKTTEQPQTRMLIFCALVVITYYSYTILK